MDIPFISRNNSNNKLYRINPQTYKKTEIPTTTLSISNHKLGEGSQGVVYKAIYKLNDNDEKIVAVKKVLINGDKNLHITGIYNEVKVLSQIDNDGISKFIDFICDDKYYYLVLEFIQGWDLLTFVLEGWFEKLSELTQLDIFLQCSKIIAFLHKNNIVHLDIKLENIMLMPIATKTVRKSSSFRVVFIDFSFSKMDIQDDTYSTLFAGSIQFADPDTLSGIPYLAKAADVWMLGVTIHRTLAINNLFDVSTDELFYYKILRRDPIEFNFPRLKQYVPLLKTILVYNSHQRPNIYTIIEKLEQLKNKITKDNDNIDDDNNDDPIAFITQSELSTLEIDVDEDIDIDEDTDIEDDDDEVNPLWFTFSNSLPSVRSFPSFWKTVCNSTSEK